MVRKRLAGRNWKPGSIPVIQRGWAPPCRGLKLSSVIARNEATKQSIFRYAALWIASTFALRATADTSLRSQ
jgi:hypothetical protein